MEDRKLIFIAGLHRSGTSLLYQIMREHSELSGFHNTGVHEDEGQHLQSVYEPAKNFGGPGKFALTPRAYMDETHPLATPKSAEKIFRQWSRYFDKSDCEYFIEKSPPNIIRTRFLQKLFPASRFIVILRHPVAICYATKGWGKREGTIPALLEHTLFAYEIFLRDMASLNSVYALRYEEFVLNPQKAMDDIYDNLGLDRITIHTPIVRNTNKKYFRMWKADIRQRTNRDLRDLPEKFESRINKLGYSLHDLSCLVHVPWIRKQRNDTEENRRRYVRDIQKTLSRLVRTRKI